MAASATLALKAGACVRRVRFVIVAPDPRHSRRSQAGFPLNELSEFGRPPLGSPENTPSPPLDRVACQRQVGSKGMVKASSLTKGLVHLKNCNYCVTMSCTYHTL